MENENYFVSNFSRLPVMEKRGKFVKIYFEFVRTANKQRRAVKLSKKEREWFEAEAFISRRKAKVFPFVLNEMGKFIVKALKQHRGKL